MFRDQPGLLGDPDWGDEEYLYAPGELSGYYGERVWLYSRSFVFDDDSGDIAHQHAAEEHVAEECVFKKFADRVC